MMKLIEKWIRLLDGSPGESYPLDTQIERISAALDSSSAEGTVMLAGDAVCNDIILTCAQKFEALHGSNRFAVGGNICVDLDTAKKAHTCENVILFIKKGHSTYAGVGKQIKEWESLQKKVIGCIFVV